MIYLENSSTDPYYNLAYEEYFFNKNDNEQYFWLWQNDNAIIIGKNQNTHEEINKDFVNLKNIKVVRRITGGGAVYHDMGNINFTYITEKESQRNMQVDFKSFTEPLINALASFGVKAENSGRNDITIDGKKISGNAQYISNNKILHHGTLLFDSNLDILSDCLKVSSEKINTKGISSVKSRVCNISEYLDVSINEFKTQLIDYIFSKNKDLKKYTLTQNDIREINSLSEKKYKTWEWNYGKSPKYNLKAERRIDNCGTICIYIELEGDTIISCKIKGDYFHTGNIEFLERIIENTKLHNLNGKLSNIAVSEYIKNLSNDDFISIITSSNSLR